MNLFQPDKNTIVELPLSLIEVPHEWNSRSGKLNIDSGDEESQEFSDLKNSIAAGGQKTPVEVRLTSNREKPYQLVKGFRRTTAILELAKQYQDPEPVIRAIVVDIDEVEARTENLMENVTRQNLTPPDFAWGLHQLHLAAKKTGKKLSDAEIARRIGRNQSYVGKLLGIMRNVQPNITRRWRETPKAVSVGEMHEIGKLPKDEQDGAFGKLLGANQAPDEDQGKHRSGWYEGAKKKAFEFGHTLGVLEREGLIDTAGLDFETHLDFCMKLRESASKNHRRGLATQMNRGYQTGLKTEEQPDLESDE
jgi:ParB/RepB/Spo0J family partition protein